MKELKLLVALYRITWNLILIYGILKRCFIRILKHIYDNF